MKTFTTVYKNEIELYRFIDENNISCHSGNILIQVFTHKNQKKFIDTLNKTILEVLPKAHIIGTTTCGEICNDGLIENSTVISFSIFYLTSLLSIYKDSITNPFATGQEIAYELLENGDDLKCVIAFSDGLHFNTEQIVNGINSIKSDIILSGGIAGDNLKFNSSFVFNQNTILSNGIVIIGLYSKDLYVHTDCNFNWLSIGKVHTITSSKENKVFTIDNMTSLEFYKHYLGDDIEQFLPNIGIEFPLIIQNQEIPIARAVLQKYDDGILQFAGALNTGTKIKFGYGDIEMILNHSKDMANKINNHIPIESIFIYSCIARKSLLKKDINMEILPLKNIAPISGFFTYGEFFNYKNNNYLLNETMTIITLSESKELKQTQSNIIKNQPNLNPDFIRQKALSNLISHTSQELETLQNDLQNQITIAIHNSIEKDNLLKLNSKQAMLGEMIDMILHQWRQPLSSFALATSTLQLFKETGQLSDTLFDKHTDIMMTNVHFLNETITIFRDFFNPTKVNDKTKPSQIVHKISILFAALLKKYYQLLNIEIANDEWFNINENELIQVLLNLIKNSIDEFEKNKISTPTIFLRFTNNKGYLNIEVEDNAGGIEESLIDKVFDKQFTTKSNNGGSGVGLSMSKQIVVNNLKGKIFALNGAYGAIFKLKIPLK